MEELRFIIARNIVELRKNQSITQAELAERLNYSDKAVSKWERGESLPDITVLKKVADIFGVSVDYLLSDDHTEYRKERMAVSRRQFINRVMIMMISIVLVIGLALFVFVNINWIAGRMKLDWAAFVVALPVVCIVWLVFNTIWFKRENNYLIISLLLWSLLTSVFILTMNVINMAWLVFLLGIPGQIIIILWSRIKPAKRSRKTKN